MKKIENEHLVVQIAEAGAELQSICEKSTGREYLWQRDPQYWDGCAPILFPNVGAVWNKVCRVEGVAYDLPKHGFANKQLFTVVEHTEAYICFAITYTPETLAVYPYQFELRAGYRLQGRKLVVEWEVVNLDTKTIYFQLGGHPSFNYVDFSAEDEVHGYISFDAKAPLQTRLIGEQGCAANEFAPVPVDEQGMLVLTNTAFALDTYVLQENQVSCATLHNKAREPYARVRFSTPVLCIWSPCDGKAPFVCIEPWAGLCDTVGYEGDISGRNFIHHAEAGSSYATSYEVELL